MRPDLKIFVAFALIAAADVALAQQASSPATAPAQPQAETPKPPAKPPLKLRLDEIERRPAVTFGQKNDVKKNDSAQSLPGLGGNPSKAWETSPPPSTVIPITNENIP